MTTKTIDISAFEVIDGYITFNSSAISIEVYSKLIINGLCYVEYRDGCRYWSKGLNLHRENGPAIENDDGSKKWFINGELHREDGPAVITSEGYMEWYFRGKVHREDGPAVISKGSKKWFLHGWYFTELEHFRKSPYFQNMSDEEKIYHRLMIK